MDVLSNNWLICSIAIFVIATLLIIPLKKAKKDTLALISLWISIISLCFAIVSFVIQNNQKAGQPPIEQRIGQQDEKQEKSTKRQEKTITTTETGTGSHKNENRAKIVDIESTAQTLTMGEIHKLNIGFGKPSDFKIVTPESGNLTLSLETFAEYTRFALYNEDGASFKPVNVDITSGKMTKIYGIWLKEFGRGDNVVDCYWHSSPIERFKGSFIFKLDAGTYNLRLIRTQTGLSTANLSIQFKAL